MGDAVGESVVTLVVGSAECVISPGASVGAGVNVAVAEGGVRVGVVQEARKRDRRKKNEG